MDLVVRIVFLHTCAAIIMSVQLPWSRLFFQAALSLQDTTIVISLVLAGMGVKIGYLHPESCGRLVRRPAAAGVLNFSYTGRDRAADRREYADLGPSRYIRRGYRTHP